MRKLLLIVFALGASSAFAQSAFDGTWHVNPQSGAIKAHDKYSLQNGMWRCDTCAPKTNVKADGNEQKLSGSPYADAISVRALDDRTVETKSTKAGKPTGSTKLMASEDGRTLTTEWSFTADNGQHGNGKYNSERVGAVPASGNKVSGTWQPRKIEDASESVSTVTYKATADGLSMSDPLGDSYDAKFDGKDYPYKGDPGTTSVSLKKIDANTIEETDKRNGKVIAVSRMTVGADGKTMKVAVDDKLHNATANWTAEKQ
jgi:hypothetical protein